MKNYLSKAQYFFSKSFLRVQCRKYTCIAKFRVFIQLQESNRRLKFRYALREVDVEIEDHLKYVISRSYIFTSKLFLKDIFYQLTFTPYLLFHCCVYEKIRNPSFHLKIMK